MKNEFLRHTLATINYRFNKSVKYRNAKFGDFSLGKGSRTTIEIINHMYDVLIWTIDFVEKRKYQNEEPQKLGLEEEIKRFIVGIENLDKILSENELDIDHSKRLIQGPLSDILTHIGQISMLSRLNNRPIEYENFSAASIQTGTY